MLSLNALLRRYREAHTHEQELFAAATRFCRAIATAMHAPDPDDVAQRAVLEFWMKHNVVRNSVSAWLRARTRTLILNDARTAQRRVQTQALPCKEEDGDAMIVLEDRRPTRNPSTISDPQLRVATTLMLLGFSSIEAADHAGMKLSSLRWKAMRQAA